MPGENDGTTITGEGKPDPAAEAKAAEEKLNAGVAALELSLPKGFDVKDPSLAEFKKHAVQAGLDSKKAQVLFDFHHKTLGSSLDSAKKAFQQSALDDLTTARKGWREELAGDKEFGGKNLEATRVAAQKVFARYTERVPELKGVLEDTGWGDHPALVKLFAAVGKDLGEDTVARKGAAAGAAPAARKAGHIFSDDADLKAMFPNSPEMFTG